jgi:predicted DNA repair protein MutK
MATGLIALLDDVVALVKAGAANLDDISAQVAKTSSKVSGVVIDDAAVTPKYVVGLDPARELSIIFAIAKKSLLNKLLILSPVALVLGYFLPWLIQPLLMLGGSYLCFEGYEKVHGLFAPHSHHDAPDDAPTQELDVITPKELEAQRIGSAVRTDFILSSEIIAITYANIAQEALLNQIIIMLLVAIGITVGVYGFVGLVVKMDDIGLHFARGVQYPSMVRSLSRGIVKAMPPFLIGLSYLGTLAMLWVGAEIIAHGIPPLHHALEHLKHALAFNATVAWLCKVLLLVFFGLLVGAIIAMVLNFIQQLKPRRS